MSGSEDFLKDPQVEPRRLNALKAAKSPSSLSERTYFAEKCPTQAQFLVSAQYSGVSRIANPTYTLQLDCQVFEQIQFLA
jgi:hypothetical protein